jgi:hypothetical protein
MSATPYDPPITDRIRWAARRLWERFFPPQSNLEWHAEQELRAAGFFDKDSDYGGLAATAVMELVRVFGRQGHSGYSAGLVRDLFAKVAAYEPLCPLTGADDEWVNVHDDTYQNKRCNHVFKEGKDGRAYDIDGRIFREPNGNCYTSRDSRVYIDFPYTPTREYVDVPE